MSNIPKLLDELSYLSRETKGASFNIQHSKETGEWKVAFVNAMSQVRNDQKLKYERDFDTALQNAIDWIRERRKPTGVVTEKFTLY